MTRFDMQEYIAHYGIRGQRWGIRNYQNLDGSLTPAGRQRYGTSARGRARMYTQGLKSTSRYANSLRKGSKKLEKKMNRAASKMEDYDNMHPKAGRNAFQKVSGRMKERRVEKYESEIKNNHMMASYGQKEVERILSTAISEGYKVTVKDRSKHRKKGETTVAYLLDSGSQHILDQDLRYKVKKTRYSITTG